MGCFSFICKECGKPILSNSFVGEEVRLYLLNDGSVLESMAGQYDSYGRVFNEEHDGSIDWTVMEWSDIVDLMYNEVADCGIAAVHEECFTGTVPGTFSKDDPNQGWGDE